MGKLEEAISRMLKPFQLMSLATITEDGEPWVRYVMGSATDTWEIRIATFADSRKVAQIRKHPKVHLCCGVTEPAEENAYLQISGTAAVRDDADLKQAVWHEGLSQYFNGPDDPNYVVIAITPERIEYMAEGAMSPQTWENRRKRI